MLIDQDNTSGVVGYDGDNTVFLDTITGGHRPVASRTERRCLAQSFDLAWLDGGARGSGLNHFGLRFCGRTQPR